jgi:Cu-processing system permease protein
LNRSSIFLGKLAGFTAPLVISIVVGLGLPFLLHGYVQGAYAAKVGMLIVVAVLLCCVFSAIAFLAAVRFDDRVKGLGSTLILWFFLAVVWDGLILLFVMIFHAYPYENALLGLILVNPIDLGRILILLNLDISSLMGYTGAMFKQFFGTNAGIAVSILAMCVYAIVPAFLGLRRFQNRDF